MDAEKIRSILQHVFHDVFDDSAIVISRDTSANDVKGWDSFNHVRLIVAAEEEFKISMSTAEVAELRNVGELMDLISHYIANTN